MYVLQYQNTKYTGIFSTTELPYAYVLEIECCVQETQLEKLRRSHDRPVECVECRMHSATDDSEETCQPVLVPSVACRNPTLH